MLDIKDIIKRPEWYVQGIAKKQGNTALIQSAIDVYEKRNQLLARVEQLQSEQNALAKALPQLQDKAESLAKMSELKTLIKSLEPEKQLLQDELNTLLSSLPNPAHESVPEGKDDTENSVLRFVGEKPEFDFEPLPHWELGEKLDLIDSAAGAKVAGARFHFLKNELVLMQFALVQYAFSILHAHGFTPVLPPYMVNKMSAYGTGFLDSGHEDEVYAVNPGRDDLYLIGTSEVPNTAYYANEIIPAEQLPIRLAAYSPCFRREAGSSGKDQKGILRCHQFDKIEMGIFALPEQSWDEHELLLSIEEKIWTGLGIHYQVLNICGGDLGGPAAKKYDIEAWMPGQSAYREVTSTSNCTDFQARRLQIRYSKEGKNAILHTLNGTGIAIGRCLIAIMENYQTKEGGIHIPEVLRPWMPVDYIAPRKGISS